MACGERLHGGQTAEASVTAGAGRNTVVLVGGGARSGKSAYALRRAASMGERRAFLATAEVGDSEMRERIDLHRAERGEDFQTLEVPLELPEALASLGDYDVAVVDCLTLWVSNLMWQGEEAEADASQVEQRIDDLVEALGRAPCHVIIVSNEVGMGIVPMHASARAFRDHIGRAHQRVAEVSDEVVLAALGCLIQVKPVLQLVPNPRGPGQRSDS